MGATGLVLTSRWRRRTGDQVALALVIAIAGAVVLATLAGAQRTETAYARFDRAASNPDVVLATKGPGSADLSDEQIATIESLPEVRGAGRMRALAMQPAVEALYQPIAAPLDDGIGTRVLRSRFVAGRAPEHADEMSMTEQRAALLGLHLGDRLAMASYTPEQVRQYQGGDDSIFDHPDGPTVELTLVGIERTPLSVSTDRDIASITMLAPAFLDEYGDRVGSWTDLLGVDLVGDGGAIDEFTNEVHQLPGLADLHFEASVSANVPIVSTLDFVATALRVFAAIGALAGSVAVALVLVRAMSVERLEGPVLNALGWDARHRRRLLVLGITPGIAVGIVGAVVAATLASTLFPFGLGRRVEPTPGIDIAAPALVIGTAIIVGGVAALTAVAAWWVTRDRRAQPPHRQSRFVRRLAGLNLSVTSLTGVRFVAERGRRGDTIAARSAITAVALSVAGLLGVLTYTSSRQWLDSNPAAWGRTWDVAASGERIDELIPPDAILARTRVRISTVELDGHPLEVRGFDALVGPSLIPIATGRHPGPGEVALGSGTMAALGVSIGDTVTLKGSSATADMRVVGEAMFSGISDLPVLNSGAAMEFDTLLRICDPDTDDHFDTDVLRLVPGTADIALLSALAEQDRIPTTDDDVRRLVEGDRPDEFRRLDEVRSLPWLLGAFLTWLAVTASVALLVGAVRRRRHDLAVLRAMGLERRGVGRVVRAQAFTVSVAGLAIGIPAGIIIGRLAWTTVARSLGVVVHISTPWAATAIIAIAMIALDTLVSMIPAIRAGRSTAAFALRAE
jgi:hypothetical protein